MSKNKAKPAVGLFIVLIVLFVLGMLAEIALKYFAVPLRVNMPEVSAEVYRNNILMQFSTEEIPLYALPSIMLAWMQLMPRNVWAYAIRWLPYLVLFLMTAFSGLFRGRGRAVVPFICAFVALYEGISMIIVDAGTKYPQFSFYYAVPFIVEFILLTIGCSGIVARSRRITVTAGVIFLIIAPLSAVTTAIITEAGMGLSLPGFPIRVMLANAIKNFPVAYAASQWPIFKAFAFVMYGLLFVTAVHKGGKKA